MTREDRARLGAMGMVLAAAFGSMRDCNIKPREQNAGPTENDKRAIAEAEARRNRRNAKRAKHKDA